MYNIYYIEWLFSNDRYFNHSTTPAASVDSISCGGSISSDGRALHNNNNNILWFDT